MFSNEVHDAFRQHGIQCFPFEAVGLVVRVNGVDEYVACENIAENPQLMFKVDGKVYAEQAERGEIMAVLHTHVPNEQFPKGLECPSKKDMELQIALDVPFGIALASQDSCAVPYYFGDQVPIPPLIGREYLYNVNYCFSLMRDYFRTRENDPFTLPPMPTDNWWWKDGLNVFEENVKAYGFKDVPLEDVRVGDVFLMRVRSPVLNHCGVMVSAQLIAHHCLDALSVREPVGRWAPLISRWVRHERDFK